MPFISTGIKIRLVYRWSLKNKWLVSVGKINCVYLWKVVPYFTSILFMINVDLFLNGWVQIVNIADNDCNNNSNQLLAGVIASILVNYCANVIYDDLWYFHLKSIVTLNYLLTILLERIRAYHSKSQIVAGPFFS